MAKIIKITPAHNATQVVNPFKTSRNTTNPFRYSNFEGNTLQFADVFEGFEPKKINKMKLIASSVAGSMHKMKVNIVESAVRFALRMKSSVVAAWDYAKNTNVSDLKAVKKFSDIMNTQIEIPGVSILESSIDKLKGKVSEKIDLMNTRVVDFGKEIGEKWNAMVSKVKQDKITSETPVAELERLWKAELAVAEIGGNV